MSDTKKRLVAEHGEPEFVLPPPTAPMSVARTLVASNYTHPSGAMTLRYWRGVFARA